METTANTYGGLNMDTSYDSIPNTFYIDALDVRITTVKGESQGSISNIKGNLLSFSIPQLGTGVSEIIGSTAIRNTIILFITDTSNAKGWIYKLIYNDVNHTILTGPTLVYYNATFGFSKLYPIEAVGRYESDLIQRIYWSDYNSPLRSLNIADPNVLITDLSLIDVNPYVGYTQPLLQAVTGGGNLLVGLYQIAYRLITFDGKQTLISPPSNMIHIVSNSETVTNSAQYGGDPKGVNSFKSITCTIDTTNYSNYEKIELIVLFHEDFQGTPVIKSIETQSIGVATSVVFTYTGSETTAIPLTSIDFALKSYPFSTCKTLTQVDSSLVIANLKSTSFDIQSSLGIGETFDASTLRYDSAGTTMVGKTNFRASGSPVFTADEVKFNTIYNEDAHWDAQWHTDGQYKFKDDGTTLGGQGPNISYTFHLESMFINEGNTSFPGVLASTPYTTHNLIDGYSYNNTTFDSQGSPFISGLLRGYKRGETYRFGIIFYNLKGEASFVEYIGDIKFPDISEADGVVNGSGGVYFPLSQNTTGTSAEAYSMGIKFDIDFSTCATLMSQVDSYQIVRLDRLNDDKRRMCSGVMRTFSKAPIGAPPSGGYDLRVGGSSDVLHLAYITDSGRTNNNGSFSYLEDVAANASNHELKGSYMTFYSPEISYNFNNVSDIIVGNSSSLLLITGGFEYIDNVDTNSNTVSDRSAIEKLGTDCADVRWILNHVVPVDKVGVTATYPINSKRRGIEYVKRIKQKQKVSLPNSLAENDAAIAIVTPLFDGNYMRNFYARSNPASGGTAKDLNNCSSSAGGDQALFKGATGITGNIVNITNDILTNVALPVSSATDYFNSTNVISQGSSMGQVLLDVMIPKQEVYGGYNDSALENNIFIPASPVIKKANTTPIVFGGDIFLNTFVFQASSTYNSRLYYNDAVSADQKYKGNVSLTQLYTVESCVNSDLNYGATIKSGVKFSVAGGTSGILDTLFRQESSNSDRGYAKVYSMYAYNNVYSESASDLSFFVKPVNLSLSIVNDIRAMISNPKINNEALDSWTKFLVNNYWDVDDHGPINKIINWRGNTYFFQDSAVGSYSINPRAVVTTTDGVETQLGTGQGITYHNYITTENGSIHQWGIKATDKGIYYFDGLIKKIFILTGGVSPISEMKGVHSFLNNLTGDVFLKKENGGDNPIMSKGVIIGQDIVNDEILFTFLGNAGELRTPNKTIVFDELASQFSSRYSIVPKVYIDNKNILLTSDPISPDKVYLQNEGAYGNFYGIVQECFVKLVVNDKADVNKILRFIEFNSIVRDSNKVIDRTITITAFKIETENQTTSKVPFSVDRFKHKFNKWRLKIPRDQNSATKQGRLRNTYFIVTLYFDNTSNKELILNRLISHYDIQIF